MRALRQYHVVWAIEIDAATPTDAASAAFRLIRDPDTFATVFEVTDPDGHTTVVDLLPDDLPVALA